MDLWKDSSDERRDGVLLEQLTVEALSEAMARMRARVETRPDDSIVSGLKRSLPKIAFVRPIWWRNSHRTPIGRSPFPVSLRGVVEGRN